MAKVKIPFQSGGYYVVQELKNTAMPSGVSETIYLIDQISSYVEIRISRGSNEIEPSYKDFNNNANLILSSFHFLVD